MMVPQRSIGIGGLLEKDGQDTGHDCSGRFLWSVTTVFDAAIQATYASRGSLDADQAALSYR